MGLQKNALFREELMNRTRELGLADVISFAAFSQNVEKEIKDADVVLNFSEAESFSMTCLEASFYGRAVIATRCGGPEEIVQHEQTGLLVAKGDLQAMTNAMLLMADEPELRRKFGAEGSIFVRAHFSIDNFKKAFTSITAPDGK